MCYYVSSQLMHFICIIPTPEHNDNTSFLCNGIRNNWTWFAQDKCVSFNILWIAWFVWLQKRKVPTFWGEVWVKEIDLSLHWVTHLFYPLVFTFLFWFFVCHLIGEISPKLFFVSRMPTDSVRRKWQMPTQTPVTLPKRPEIPLCGPRTSNWRNE